MLSSAAFCLIALSLAAAEHHGRVTSNGLPIPGATITVERGGKQFVTSTDMEGFYSFDVLGDGHWSVGISMSGFAPLKQDVLVTAGAPASTWELQMLPLDLVKAQMETATVVAATPTFNPEASHEAGAKQPPAALPAQELTDQAADSLLINGSVNNGAASPFAQLAAFGNSRTANKRLYNGGVGLTFDNSALDANPFSLTGQATPRPDYNRMTGLFNFGGPLRIPRLIKNGPFVFLAYQWTRNRNATTQTGLVPDAAERDGLFSQTILDPTTGLPFPGNQIPASRISPQAQALLKFYPLPTFPSGTAYNYEIPLLGATHQDALQSRFNQRLGTRDQLSGRFAFQSMRMDNPNLFDFEDRTDTFGIDTGIKWSHRFGHRLFLILGYQYSYFSTRVKPNFKNRENVSGLAGITGNDQQPADWGPPSLVFSSGIAELGDAESAFNRNQTSAVSPSITWNRGKHNLQFGGDFRRQQFNYLSEQNGRGAFTFTGVDTGFDFADFLLGVPDASAIAFGNADKYFRESVYDGYFTDDWRIGPDFSLNAGMRWEYGAPITELYGRLVNLDIAPNFTAAAPVVGNGPLHPDKRGVEPRVGFAWRSPAGSSLVVRGGYGIYYDTSVYQTIATQMAQQAPLSKSLSVQNSAANPLTLANGFNASPSATPDTFAVDPNFRVGYAQTWQLSVQTDLPASLQLTATYLGIKGTRGVQELLPNTYPIGGANPCPGCPIGFAYLTSNGDSSRESAEIQLRRRLHNGVTGVLQYTFSKSLDDDGALGGQGTSATGQTVAAFPGQTAATGQQGMQIAQNWLRLSAERSLSIFDQRHLLSLQVQYTTGMGIGGGTLLSGWRGALLKEWTFATLINAGSGLPETPIDLATVPGTGFTGTLRPDYTGQPLYSPPAGLYLNPAAFTAPPPGQWGNAGRNSIMGPAEFSLNVSMGRTFRLNDRFNIDFRVDSNNALNHVSYTAWETIINSTQFGLPAGANAMRSVQTTLRLKF